ncbi:MAG: signal peptidase I [Bacilli bacterium]|nr:signal peptidase I [Bacilli bacterium]
MKKNDFLVIGILSLIIILSIVNIFFKILNGYTLFLVTILLLGIAIWQLGYEKNKSLIEKDVVLSITAYLIFYYLVIYIIGYFIGFTKNIYNTEIKTIFLNTFPVIINIIACEVLRYVINTRAKNYKTLIVLSFIAFTLINNTIIISGIVSSSAYEAMNLIEQLGLFILPLVATNILVTYLSIKAGYKSSIIFRFFMELPLYILPIFPKFGNYIDSVLRITIPILVFLWLYHKIDKINPKKIVIIEKKKLLNLFRINIILFCLIMIYFVSGLFRYQVFVIATGSMQPNINIGDIVIVDKTAERDFLHFNEGDVIAYKKENIVVCHRIIKVINSGKTTLYETKGDNNDSSDQLLVLSDQVVGIVKYKIKYIGYPTVLLNNYR